ncbi:MAG TPA: hypothetical protein VGT41_00315, partial [Candidatus Babeliales bacterium]|nr:hypothetical protein [Candidatus Babeliales bacterium]
MKKWFLLSLVFLALPCALHAAHTAADLKERERAQVTRQRRLEVFQQTREEADVAARRAAAAQGNEPDISLVTDFGLDDPDTQQAIAESLKPQKKPARTKKLTKETKEEDEKEQDAQWLERFNLEEAAARARRGGRPVEYSRADVTKLVGAVPSAVSKHMEPFAFKGTSFLDEDADVISTMIQADRPITCLGISSDSKFICGASESGTIYIWDAITEKLVRRVDSGIKKPLAISADGLTVVTGDVINKAISIWNVATKVSKTIKKIVSKNDFFNIALTNNGRDVIVGAYVGGWIGIFNAATGKIRSSWFQDVARITDVAGSFDGRFIITGDNRAGVVRVFDAGTGLLVNAITAPLVVGVAISANNDFIATGSHSGAVHIWEGRREGLINTLKHSEDSGTNAIAISTDGNFITAAYADGIRIWRLKSSVANAVYARRGYVIDEAEKLRDQAKAMRKFPVNRLRAINKGVALLKSADMTRKDFEAYIGKIKNRINKEFQEGRDEAVV